MSCDCLDHAHLAVDRQLPMRFPDACFGKNPGNQLCVPPRSCPTQNTLLIESVSDRLLCQTSASQLDDPVDERCVHGIHLVWRQTACLDNNLHLKLLIACLQQYGCGSSEIIRPSRSSPNFWACPHPCPVHTLCDTPATAAAPRAAAGSGGRSAQAGG